MFALLYGMMLISIIMPDKVYSEAENKYLSTMPSPSFKSILNGTFQDKYATYVSDQMPLRDTWINLKSLSESAMLKTENNGIIYGKDGYLFQRFMNIDNETLDDNIDAVNRFIEKATCPVHVMIVPSSYSVLSDKLPANLTLADQTSLLDVQDSGNILERFQNCDVIDLLTSLSHHKDEYIYYRTDHHWTTQGAWYAYNALCASLGADSYLPDEDRSHTVEGFLGTSYSRCKKTGQQTDSITYYDFNAVLTESDVKHDTIYDYTKLSTRDKYAMFLYGNGAERQIESAPGDNKKPSALIIKDSFADSLIPFLTMHYESITCIDPRYYSGSFTELAERGFDDIIIIFGFEDLSGEASIMKLGF